MGELKFIRVSLNEKNSLVNGEEPQKETYLLSVNSIVFIRGKMFEKDVYRIIVNKESMPSKEEVGFDVDTITAVLSDGIIEILNR